MNRIEALIGTAAEKTVLEVMEVYKGAIVKEWEEQGHRLTGKSVQEIEIKVDEKGRIIQGRLLVAEYWDYQERGVKPEHIPFTLGSGRKKSKYIAGLIRYFRLRGLSGKEAKGAAFATAIVQKREGMQTRASRRFSSSGRRKGFISEGVDSKEREIVLKVENTMNEILAVRLRKEFTDQLEKIVFD